MRAFVGMNLWAVVVAGLLVLLNTVLTFVRFRSVLVVFGYRPGWRSAAIAFTVGQISNQLLFNVVGQSLSRAAVLRRDGIPLGVTVAATYWERLMAAGLLLLFSLIGALILFLNIDIDLQAGGAYLLSLLAGLILVSAIVLAVFLRDPQIRQRLRRLPRQVFRFWPAALLTVTAHAAMLMAYVILVVDLDLSTATIAVLAALIIVMFSASLPISFGGWGVRELSAAQALGAVGIAPSVAVASAVTIGLIGLAVTIGGGALGAYLYLRSHVARSIAVPAPPKDAPEVDHDRWLGAAAAVAAVLSAILLFFQVKVLSGGNNVTLNAADVLALTSLGLFLLFAWSRRTIAPLPRWLVTVMAVMSIVLLLSLAHGYLSFGSNRWALVNRGFGWLVILGYVALGALVAFVPQRDLARRLLSAFVLAGVTIAGLQLALILYSLLFGALPADAFAMPLRGYAGNSNAFAFQMLMTAACIVTLSRLRPDALPPRLSHAALAIVFAAVFYSHSRTGLASMAFLLILMVVIAPRGDRRRAVTSMAVVAIVYGALLLLPFVYGALLHLPMFATVPDVGDHLSQHLSRPNSDSEHWLTIVQGWDLWLAQPLFGNGLGAYVQGQIEAGKMFLVIHSIPIWLLAEAGLVGFLVFVAAMAVAVVKSFAAARRPETHPWGIGLLIIMAVMAGGGLVHDFLYQRPFWFLLGLLVAAIARTKAEAAERR